MFDLRFLICDLLPGGQDALSLPGTSNIANQTSNIANLQILQPQHFHALLKDDVYGNGRFCQAGQVALQLLADLTLGGHQPGDAVVVAIALQGKDQFRQGSCSLLQLIVIKPVFASRSKAPFSAK